MDTLPFWEFPNAYNPSQPGRSYTHDGVKSLVFRKHGMLDGSHHEDLKGPELLKRGKDIWEEQWVHDWTVYISKTMASGIPQQPSEALREKSQAFKTCYIAHSAQNTVSGRRRSSPYGRLLVIICVEGRREYWLLAKFSVRSRWGVWFWGRGLYTV